MSEYIGEIKEPTRTSYFKNSLEKMFLKSEISSSTKYGITIMLIIIIIFICVLSIVINNYDINKIFNTTTGILSFIVAFLLTIFTMFYIYNTYTSF